MTTRVSVVIPTYNRGNEVLRAVRSVYDQSTQPMEVIVVDDCSTDDTVLRLNNLQLPSLKVLVNETNLGGSTTRNRGIAESLGSIICLLDSDDEWDSEHLAVQIQLLRRTQISLAGMKVNIQGQVRKVAQRAVPKSGNFHADLLALRHRSFSSSCISFRSEVKTCFAFDPQLPALQDLDLMTSASKWFQVAFSSRATVLKHSLPGERTYKGRRVFEARRIYLEKWIEDIAKTRHAFSRQSLALIRDAVQFGDPNDIQDVLNNYPYISPKVSDFSRLVANYPRLLRFSANALLRMT